MKKLKMILKKYVEKSLETNAWAPSGRVPCIQK